MAKKTNPTPAKTAKKKPVTMAERVTLERVFEATTRIHVQHTKALNEIKRMVENCEVRIMQRMDSRIDATTGRLLKDIVNMGSLINERLDAQRKIMEPFVHAQELSTPKDVTGSPVDIKVTIPEQWLEPGDYTDASKEVADALTGMGWTWGDGDRTECEYIVWDDVYNMILNSTCQDKNKLPQATFLSRAAVTAKAIGLVAKEEEPWKPEVGELVVCECGDFPETCPRGTIGPVICLYPNGAIDMVGLKGASRHMFVKEYRQPTPEEVAKYHADIEAAKPIVFGTRVEHSGRGKGIWMGMDGILHELAVLRHGEGRQHQWSTLLCPRSAFTVID